MKRFLGVLFVLIGGVCLSNLGYAETLVLTTGEQITAPILQKTDAYVIVDTSSGPYTYYLAEIQSIDGQDAFTSAGTTAVQATPAPVAQSQASQPNNVPDYGDEEQSLINFMNARSAAAQATSAPAAAIPVAAATPTAPVTSATAASAPAALATPSSAAPAVAATPAPAAPAAPVAVTPDPNQLPTLQQFLQTFFSQIVSFFKSL